MITLFNDWIGWEIKSFMSLGSVKKWGWVLLLVGLIAVTPWVYEEITGDFRISNITYDLPYDLSWAETAEEPGRLDTLLQGNYHWVGQGHQVYVFASEDNQHVLKVFKFKRLRPSLMLHYLSYVPLVSDYVARYEKKRLNRFDKLFRGHKVAYEDDSEHTGILYAHLNVTDHLKRSVTVEDKLGRSYVLDLDATIFVIQEKARMTKDVFKELLNAGNVSLVKQRIGKLLDMYVAEYRLGVIDQDHNVMSNTGFVGDRPIRLDVGQLQRSEAIKDPEVYMRDLRKITHVRLEKWFSKNYPQYAEELAQAMEQKLAELRPVVK